MSSLPPEVERDLETTNHAVRHLSHALGGVCPRCDAGLEALARLRAALTGAIANRGLCQSCASDLGEAALEAKGGGHAIACFCCIYNASPGEPCVYCNAEQDSGHPYRDPRCSPPAEVEPGQLIAKVACPCCGADLTVEHGDDPGEIGVIGVALAEPEVSEEFKNYPCPTCDSTGVKPDVLLTKPAEGRMPTREELATKLEEAWNKIGKDDQLTEREGWLFAADLILANATGWRGR